MLKIAFHPAYIHPVPIGHRFPMLKYELIPAQLLHEGVVDAINFFTPQLADRDTVCLAHDEQYVDDLLNQTLDAKMIRRIGFSMNRALIDRELYLVDGTVKGAIYALSHGVAFNVAGGTHHAGRDFGEGFCLLNDQAVAAAYLYHNHICQRILMIDLDVHQGNGTAHIFQDHDAIFTFSMHGQKNYPFIKEKSHLDIGLDDGMEDKLYLSILRQNLTILFQTVKPDFVFYQAGVDILQTDKLGKLSLTAKGCQQRDEMVFSFCKRNAIPIQVSMGGGYSTDIRDIVNAHVETYRTAIDIFEM